MFGLTITDTEIQLASHKKELPVRDHLRPQPAFQMHNGCASEHNFIYRSLAPCTILPRRYLYCPTTDRRKRIPRCGRIILVYRNFIAQPPTPIVCCRVCLMAIFPELQVTKSRPGLPPQGFLINRGVGVSAGTG